MDPKTAEIGALYREKWVTNVRCPKYRSHGLFCSISKGKYGKDYEKYCKLVPFRMLPGIF